MPCRRRPSGAAQCAGAGGGAGAGRRQQHGDHCHRRHRRRDAGARQGPRDPADQHLRARHVDRAPCRSARSPGVSAAAPPSRSGRVCGVLAGLICCAGGAAGLVSAVQSRQRSSAGSMPPRTWPTALPPPTPRVTPSSRKRFRGCCSAAYSPAIIGPQLVIFTKDLWQPYLFAATYLGQAALAAICAGGADVRRTSRSRRRARPAATDGRSPRSRASRASSWRSPAASRATR